MREYELRVLNSDYSVSEKIMTQQHTVSMVIREGQAKSSGKPFEIWRCGDRIYRAFDHMSFRYSGTG